MNVEFWEGAVLIVGGLFLVDRVTRKPAAVAPSNANLAINTAGLTRLTNTAGTSSLIAGEPLAAPTPSVSTSAVPVHVPVTARPIRAPLAGSFTRRPVSPARPGIVHNL
jgi:hypothetical protein